MKKDETTSASPKSLHEGHRKRLRERYLTQGLEGFQNHEILELLLFYAVPMRDTNELAHRLLNAFGGSLARVLEAPPELLCEVSGISQNSAVLVSMLLPTLRAYQRDAAREMPVLDSYGRAEPFLRSQFMGYTQEHAMLVCMDAKSRVISARIMASGSASTVFLPLRQVVQEALRQSAARIIFAHNHPGGDPAPSASDIRYTLQLQNLLLGLDIQLDDHIVVGSEVSASMRQMSYLKEGKLYSSAPKQELSPYDPFH